MRPTKGQDTQRTPQSQPSHASRLADRTPTIGQPATKELQIKALLLAGLSAQEVAIRYDVRLGTVKTALKQLLNEGESLKVLRYLAKHFADNPAKDYKPDMEKIGEIAELLSGWDSAAISRLADDLRSGKLAQHYAAAAEPEATVDRSTPPDGQLYADRPDRKESAPQFIERVYGGAGWLTGDFTRADLRKVDPKAVAGLINWERANGRASVNLPTLKERNDRRLEAPTDGVGKLERMERQRLAATRRYKSRQLTN